MKALRKCWALFHAGTGEFVRAIANQPDRVTRQTMPFEYVKMVEARSARVAKRSGTKKKGKV